MKGLWVDGDGRVVCGEDGDRLSIDEAAERGPAVEMAVRAREALGAVEVEHSAPHKREGGGANFVNVQVAGESLTRVVTWAARLNAEIVFTLDGSLKKLVNTDGEERMVAAWAAVSSEGEVIRGALTAEARDNYMAEFAAQMAVAASAWRRVVIVMDATSPVGALWSFMGKCDRQRQRAYRRDWLDTWALWLDEFEAIAFVWQTSHVGAPINEWADAEAENAANADLPEELPDIQPARYASIEIAAGGEGSRRGLIVRRGVRAWATEMLSKEVVVRLRRTSKITQMRGERDLALGRLSAPMEEAAEKLLGARLQLGDAKRYCSDIASRMAKAFGCPFGCGCGFSWWEVAFKCKGAPIRSLRGVWRDTAREALWAAGREMPHDGLITLVDFIEGKRSEELVLGSATETLLRRVTGGCVARGARANGSDIADAWSTGIVRQAFQGGMALQLAAIEASREGRDAIAEEVRGLGKARKFARRWRLAVIKGGPCRAAGLLQGWAARREAAGLIRGEREGGRMTDSDARAAAAAVVNRVRVHNAWVRRAQTSASHRSALREWRWAAMLWAWRLRTLQTLRPRFRAASAVTEQAVNIVRSWRAYCCAIGSCVALPPVDVWRAFAGAAAHEKVGLEGRLLCFRGKIRWAGGRRAFERLRGWDVQAGLEADRFGFWAVDRLVAARKPAGGRGRQLEVLVRWQGCESVWREAWPETWLSITMLKPDLKAQARAMWTASQPPPAAVAMTSRRRCWSGLGWVGASEGQRRVSPRLNAGLVDSTSTSTHAAIVWGVVLRPVAVAPAGIPTGVAAVLRHVVTAAAVPMVLWGVNPRPISVAPAGIPTGGASVLRHVAAATAVPMDVGGGARDRAAAATTPMDVDEGDGGGALLGV